MPQTLESLKAKYQKVTDAIQQANGSLKNVNMEGDKLLIRAEVANEQLKNKIWDQIKQVDASFSDLHADIIVNSAIQPPPIAAAANSTGQRTYVVQAGENLSHIAQQFYGKASEYNKIFEANRDKMSNPDTLRAGTTLVIPE